MSSLLVGYDARILQVDLSLGLAIGGDAILDEASTQAYVAGLRLGVGVVGEAGGGGRFRVFMTPNVAVVATLGIVALFRGDNSSVHGLWDPRPSCTSFAKSSCRATKCRQLERALHLDESVRRQRLMPRLSRLILLLAGVAGAQACASQSTYIPEKRATATLGGRTAAAYGLPSQQGRQGDIRLASYGVAKFKQRNDEPVKAIHLRLAVSDSGNQPMVLDTRAQRLQLPDGRQVSAAYVASQAGARPPLIQVEPGSVRTVDLYFPIPQDLPDESSPPQFDVVWRVQVGNDTVSEITPFDQVEVDPAVARQELAEDVVNDRLYYWGDPYWRSTLVGPPFWGW